MSDMVNHPAHYQSESGVECIEVTEPLVYSLGNCVKYVWRHHDKGHSYEDLQKAAWFLDRVIETIGDKEPRDLINPVILARRYGLKDRVDTLKVMRDRWALRVRIEAHQRMEEAIRTGDASYALDASFLQALAYGSLEDMHVALASLISYEKPTMNVQHE